MQAILDTTDLVAMDVQAIAFTVNFLVGNNETGEREAGAVGLPALGPSQHSIDVYDDRSVQCWWWRINISIWGEISGAASPEHVLTSVSRAAELRAHLLVS